MREAMLIVHLLGLVMGLGNSFAFMFLGIAGSKMEKEEGKTFALNTRPLLITKLILVLVLTVSIIVTSVYAKRAKKGNTELYLKKIATLGKVALLTGIGIVLLALQLP